jgi:hypothetical protein
VEVKLLVGVNIVPDPGQQDQVEEPLGHLLLQVRREDACRLHTNRKIYYAASDIGSVLNPDPHHFGNPDPHPHQIKIRICIKIYKLDPEPDRNADFKPKCVEYEPILALFQGFEPILKQGFGSGSASG